MIKNSYYRDIMDNTRQPFDWKPFSRKQMKVLSWWLPSSPFSCFNGIICDGAVRSGKSFSMFLSFIIWAMTNFHRKNFALAGKTISSFRRNVFNDFKDILEEIGFKIYEHRADNKITISAGRTVNFFYIFGGKDEGSQDLIQGITLAGAFFDEATLQPESFVSQGVARCSIENSKVWFNCNPAGQNHWFLKEWIGRRAEKQLYRVSFLMDDNLSLSAGVKERYKKMFKGVFYLRYILGKWVAADGVIYDMFSEERHVKDLCINNYDVKIVSIDYGIRNPCVFLLLGRKGNNIYVIDEYYYDSQQERKQKTDAEYVKDLKAFLPADVDMIYCDPSALSFINAIWREDLPCTAADNSVLGGISLISRYLDEGILMIDKKCKNTIKEFQSYIWDKRASDRGEDKPAKRDDHCMDALRYGINTHFKDLTLEEVIYDGVAEGTPHKEVYLI